ncbi:MAG: DUF3108 domain-containing protein [Gemmatimonadota bacterium]
MKTRAFCLGLALAPAWTLSGEAPGVKAGDAHGPAAGTFVKAGGALTRPTLQVGERLEYAIELARLRLGTGVLAVEGREEVEGIPTFRVTLEVGIGGPFMRVEESKVSWIATEPFRSLRFEKRRRRKDGRLARRYRFDHAAGTYLAEDWSEEAGIYMPISGAGGAGPIPAAALDELGVLYLIRHLALESGRTYATRQYFETEKNPVVVRVLGTEEIRVPAGKFRTLVLEPDIPATDIFRADKKARLYVTDDARRLIVKVTTTTRLGTVVAYLRRYETGGTS